MCCQGGVHVLTIFDHYAGGWNVLVIAVLECVSVGYLYGPRRLTKDVNVMLGFNPGMPWWFVNWMVISPVLVIFGGFILQKKR